MKAASAAEGCDFARYRLFQQPAGELWQLLAVSLTELIVLVAPLFD
jgi:hypothetical protein